jgi:hypothetical protein
MTKHVQNREWGKLKEAVRGRFAEKVEVILGTMDNEEFLVNYFKLLEYVEPKLQRQEVELETSEDLTIKIEYIESNAEIKKDTDS